MKPRNLTGYSLKNIAKRLNSINIQINLQYQRPFPKPKERLLSYYTYQNRWVVKVFNNGYFNKARLVTSLINFSFIRSIVADAYSCEGGNCYDPVSLFLCNLFRWLENLPSMKDFCKLLHDRFNGHPYRTYAGISEEYIPCEADFSNFRLRIGETRYKHILAQFACIVVLLKRFLNFVVKITLTLRKFRITGNQKFLKELELRKLPAYLINIIQKK